MRLLHWPAEDLEPVVHCPGCAASTREPLYQRLTDRTFGCAPGTWNLYRCTNCGSAYLDPRPTPASIGRAYASYFTHDPPPLKRPLPRNPLKKLRLKLRNGYLNTAYGYRLQPAMSLGYALMPFFPQHQARITTIFRHQQRRSENARLLDLGCGNGMYLQQMRAAGWQVEGIDPDPNAVKAARTAGLTVHQGNIEDCALPKASFDAVTLHHVIEHVHNPYTTLTHCLRLLKPGGSIWIATPNLDAQGHQVFDSNWIGLDPPRHLILFTPDSLRSLLDMVGFQHIITPNAYNTIEWSYYTSQVLAAGGALFSSNAILRTQASIPTALAQQLNRDRRRAMHRPEIAEAIVMSATKPTG